MLFPTPLRGLWLCSSTRKAHSIFLVKQCQQGCQFDWVDTEKEPEGRSAENDPFSTELASEELLYCAMLYLIF